MKSNKSNINIISNENDMSEYNTISLPVIQNKNAVSRLNENQFQILDS